MADNVQTLADPADGDFEDWFELHNPGSDPVDLSGYFLTDTIGNLQQYRIPDGTIIPAGGFLLVWADNEPNQYTTSRPDLHANFRLAAGGELIALSTPAGAIVDRIDFGPQTADISEGRYPDGGPPPFVSMSTPTPRAHNIIDSTGENQPPQIAAKRARPSQC